MLHATSTTLADGTRARMRLPHGSDRLGMRALNERLGFAVDELDLARALRFDPRRRVVACLTAWDGTGERLLGYGAIDLHAGDTDLLVVDRRAAPGAAHALAAALRDAASRARVAA